MKQLKTEKLCNGGRLLHIPTNSVAPFSAYKDTYTTHNSSICADGGLTLKTSALKLFMTANLHYQLLANSILPHYYISSFEGLTGVETYLISRFVRKVWEGCFSTR